MIADLIIWIMVAVTGFLSAYWATPLYNFDAALHVGQYLAKDKGVHLNFAGHLTMVGRLEFGQHKLMCLLRILVKVALIKDFTLKCLLMHYLAATQEIITNHV